MGRRGGKYDNDKEMDEVKEQEVKKWNKGREEEKQADEMKRIGGIGEVRNGRKIRTKKNI